MSIIRTENLHFTYEDGTEALRGIDIAIEKGEKVALLGANGSGKSTFIFSLNGIHRPSAGKLYLHEKPYDYSKFGLRHLRSAVGVIFQDPDHQLFSAGVYQEISFGALNLGLPEEEVRHRVDKAIATLEIEPFRHKPTHFLSGGQKKQVSVADILVMDPEVIVLDEPEAALDPKHAGILNRMIDDLSSKGITIIESTHDVDHAFAWADRVILFHQGKVLRRGRPEEVFSSEADLKKTNLTKPAVLHLFEILTAKGILSAGLPIPRDLTQLESYITMKEDFPR